MKRKILVVLLAVLLVFTGCSSKTSDNSGSKSSDNTGTSDNKEDTAAKQSQLSGKTVEELVAGLSLDQKAAQMVQGAIFAMDTKAMKKYDYGSILSTFGENSMNAKEWKESILNFQKAAISSDAGIPYIYGNDAVHGVNTCEDTVIFPHNIGIGAANDEDLTYQMGKAVGNETKLAGILWTFSPCVAVAQDPRWGRTYESYSSDSALVAKLGTAFSKGLIDEKVLPCAKHFFGDGDVEYGTGENLDGINRLIDRGDAKLSDAQIKDRLGVYKTLIDAGVKTIMISHSSVNGVKMHANAKYISELKSEMGFEGFIVSDWESIHNIPGDSLKEQTITAINAGIDMLMEDSDYEECRQYIVEGVQEGSITKERVDDAVTRILKVKKEVGVLDDPMMEKMTTEVDSTGSDKYRELARKLVGESQVLLKNDNNILPIKKGTKVFVTGPAANDVGVQCGGWTITWSGKTDTDNAGNKWVPGGTTILEGLQALAADYDLTIITDEKQAAQADMTLLCLGEKPYAEWEGDSSDISITGALALDENADAIQYASKLGIPTVTLLVAGRNVIIKDYMKQWDGIVMCYLPGSEGEGVADVLTGKSSFRGKLPMPYYSSVDDIRTDKVLFPVGYGLN